MTLGDYLKAAGQRPWLTGEHDCCTFPANWVALQHDADPMRDFRGRYSTDEEAQALIDEAGSLLTLWQSALADTLCRPCDEPLAGDIGVISVVGPDGITQNGAIFTGKRWAFLAPRGLFAASIDAEHVAGVWRV